MFNASRLMAAACVVFAGGLMNHGAAQAPPAKSVNPPAKVLTTSSGVYTAAQASRGEQTYMNVCVSCHPPGTYTTPAFRAKWNGTLLSELYGLVSNTMPKNEPGALEPNDYADAIAYLLKINGAPPGKTRLPADEKALRRIRISMPAKK